MTIANHIEDSNLSLLWGKALIQVFRNSEVPMLIATLRDIDTNSPRQPPEEHFGIKDQHNSDLVASFNRNIDTVAGTIFPMGLWNPEKSRGDLFERYHKIWPRISKCSGNRNGVYFYRLISYRPGNSDDTPVNQLDHIIETYNRGNHRRSALQSAIFDPFLDHTHQRQRGFPCLQHVLFTPDNGKLIVTGIYAKQHIYERGYGNYLGLYQLGKFMAHEMSLDLATVHCIATVASLGDKVRKRDVSDFVSELDDTILG